MALQQTSACSSVIRSRCPAWHRQDLFFFFWFFPPVCHFVSVELFLKKKIKQKNNTGKDWPDFPCLRMGDKHKLSHRRYTWTPQRLCRAWQKIAAISLHVGPMPPWCLSRASNSFHPSFLGLCILFYVPSVVDHLVQVCKCLRPHPESQEKVPLEASPDAWRWTKCSVICPI